MKIRAFMTMVAIALLATARATTVLPDAKSVAAVLAADTNRNDTFSLTGVVLRSNNTLNRCFWLQDKSGSVPLRNLVNYQSPIAGIGDTIAVSGRFARELGELFANAQASRILEHGPAPEPTPVRLSEIFSGRFDHRLVRVSGIVRDAFPDEIDPNFAYLILNDGNENICLTLCSADDAVKPLFKNLSAHIGSSLSADGIVTFAPVGSRAMRGRNIAVSTTPTILSSAPRDPFDAPDLASIDRGTQPDALSRMNWHRVSGTVRAVWNATRLLVATSRGDFVNVDCSSGPLPTPGSVIEAVGLPATDFYRRNLVRARWRSIASADTPADDDPPTEISARTVLTDRSGRPKVQIGYHGRRVRLSGTITTAAPVFPAFRLLLDSDGAPITLDATADPSALSGIAPGCRLEVTGVCIIETETWQAQTPFPRITGLTVALADANGVKVLARPSWWTPARFAAVSGILLLLVAGFAVWNRILRHLIDRRSRELLREQVSRTEAGLRLDERTRLAVELHDSVAQNLTGVSLQIDAADRFAETDPARMRRHLGLASQTLLSCRDELRNCLWDLRSHALEEPDLATAVQRTVQPHIGETALHIRFPVPRARLSDQTAHAILRIIRELSINAVRHGHATQIKIAGSFDEERLLFSVEDNGGGFDPAAAPGVRQGHFGLQGIRERVRALNGTMTLQGKPGRGTYVSIALPRAPLEEKEIAL